MRTKARWSSMPTLTVFLISVHRALLLAGQETSASTLSWFILEIARHPESQERIRNEVVAIFRRIDSSGAELSSADLDDMAYTQAALKVS